MDTHDMNSFSFHGGRLADAMAQFGMGKAPWVDLSTGIIGVIFTRYVPAAELKKSGKSVTQNSASGMCCVQRPGWVCRHIFDID